MFNGVFEVTIEHNSLKIEYKKSGKIISNFFKEQFEQNDIDNFFAQDRFAKIIVFIFSDARDEQVTSFAQLSTKEASYKAKMLYKDYCSDDCFSAYYSIDSKSYKYVTIKIDDFIASCLTSILKQKNRIAAFYSKKDIIVENKNLLKLYNPSISPIVLTEFLNFCMNFMLVGGLALIIIIFSGLWEYEHSLKLKIQQIHENLKK
jgi:hypothetical protein